MPSTATDFFRTYRATLIGAVCLVAPLAAFAAGEDLKAQDTPPVKVVAKSKVAEPTAADAAKLEATARECGLDASFNTLEDIHSSAEATAAFAALAGAPNAPAPGRAAVPADSPTTAAPAAGSQAATAPAAASKENDEADPGTAAAPAVEWRQAKK